MQFEKTKLNIALEKYSYLKDFTLAGGGEDSMGSAMSAMGDVLEWEQERHRHITVVIALKDGDALGWAWMMQEGNEWESHLPKRHLLSWIYVEQENRNQGIGKALYSEIEKLARRQHRSLFVEPWDPISVKFFNKCNARAV